MIVWQITVNQERMQAKEDTLVGAKSLVFESCEEISVYKDGGVG